MGLGRGGVHSLVDTVLLKASNQRLGLDLNVYFQAVGSVKPVKKNVSGIVYKDTQFWIRDAKRGSGTVDDIMLFSRQSCNSAFSHGYF